MGPSTVLADSLPRYAAAITRTTATTWLYTARAASELSPAGAGDLCRACGTWFAARAVQAADNGGFSVATAMGSDGIETWRMMRLRGPRVPKFVRLREGAVAVLWDYFDVCDVDFMATDVSARRIPPGVVGTGARLSLSLHKRVRGAASVNALLPGSHTVGLGYYFPPTSLVRVILTSVTHERWLSHRRRRERLYRRLPSVTAGRRRVAPAGGRVAFFSDHRQRVAASYVFRKWAMVAVQFDFRVSPVGTLSSSKRRNSELLWDMVCGSSCCPWSAA